MSLVILMTFTCLSISAQEISGLVKDKNNKEPIPYSNIWLKGTTVGTMTDENGAFSLKISQEDTLCISYVGYYNIEIPAKSINKKPFVVSLSQDVQEIGEVTVSPEVSQAKVLLKKVFERKNENQKNIENIDSYKSFARTSVYIAVDSASRINQMISNMDEVSMKLDGQDLRFSPVYIAELGVKNTNGTDTVVYDRKDAIFPKLDQTIESLILLNVVIDLDFYKEQINILGKGMTSPLSSTAPLHYNYYLNDSTYVGDTKYYSFSFTPKNKYSPLFTGRFTVEDSTFALTRVFAYVQKEANINFVNGFKADVNYTRTGEGLWFYNSQEISLNLALNLKNDTASIYNSERIDEISSGNWLVTKTTKYSTSEQLNQVKPRNWKNQQEFASSNHLDDGDYKRVDKLKENSIVQGIDAIGGMALSSYVDVGKIQIGPVFDIYSTNAIEGQRFTIPFRTGENIFERYTVGGYLGYGMKTKEFKYGVNMAYQPLPSDKFILRANYSNDYNLVSQDKYLRFIKKNPNTRGNGNFIAAFTSREKNPYLKEEKSFNLILEYNADDNICIEASPYFLHSTNTPEVLFIKESIEYDTYSNYGILLNTRFAFGQHYDKYYFARVYYIDETPVVNLSLDLGQANPLDISDSYLELYPQAGSESGSDLGLYAQLHGSVVGKINMGQTALRYMVNGGHIWGDTPYDLLDQPVGSMSLGYAKYRYNLLHHASFAHNLYTNIHLDFSGGGILLNRIPLIKKLKLREMISLKCHYGTLTDAYKPVFDLPDYYVTSMSEPYAEIGFGLTNIFKVLRVEYVHQLGGSYADMGFADKSGIFFRAEMSF